jgi:hypothetical protein
MRIMHLGRFVRTALLRLIRISIHKEGVRALMPVFRVRIVVILFIAGCMVFSHVFIPITETKALAPVVVGGAILTKEVAALLVITAVAMLYAVKNQPKQKPSFLEGDLPPPSSKKVPPFTCFPLLPEQVQPSSKQVMQPLCKTITEEPTPAWPKLYTQALSAVEKVCPKSDKKCLEPWKKKLEKLIKSIQKNLNIVFSSLCYTPFPLIAQSIASFCAQNSGGSMAVSSSTLPSGLSKNPAGALGKNAIRNQPTASASPTKKTNNQQKNPKGFPRKQTKIPFEEADIDQVPDTLKPRINNAQRKIPVHVKVLLIEIMRTKKSYVDIPKNNAAKKKKGTLGENDNAEETKMRKKLNYQLQTIFKIIEHYNNLKMNIEMYEMYVDKNDVNQSLSKVLDSLEKIFHVIEYKQVNPQNYPPITNIQKISRTNQSLLTSVFPEKEDRKLLERFYEFTGTEN